jgi:hypothetical protein
LNAPLRDDNGIVEPHDHDEIQNEDLIIRRICPANHVVYDGNRGKDRLSTKAFKPSSGVKDGMSIDIKLLIENDNLAPAEYVTTPVFTGSVEFTAITARDAGLWVGFDPLEENPYHGEVWGAARANKFTTTQSKHIQNNSNWLVPLDGVDIV